ncbi:hypothetical protein [Glycomyces algeriensis]|uniref:Uncharacterized protein n=1 Tax=Glycomyces algeriensis TaxID=256037 RepID=A0A9W6LFK7_9ACTN|nr:hypothetical protein [Glycomyces algeriensis]MDA1367112.1 hypothetical protein [Glycomyces algeriensis]MDR7348501.1 hypothetical protein [Glycomyces algeriensis]GLI41205.1 hypothetical protein GALLR39Z86_10550 [Glycomyces algeriensis]
MGASPPVDPAILRAHADNLDLLGHRLESVGYVSAEAVVPGGVFGDLCAPIAMLIGEKQRDQDQLTARFHDNLELAVLNLHRMADGKRNGNPDRRPDFWASAGRGSGDQPAGSRPGRAGDFGGLIAKFRKRTWLHARLAVRGDGGAVAVRTRGALLEATSPAAPLTVLAGRLDVDHRAAAAAARRWAAMSAELREIASDLEWCLESDLAGWQGADHLAYQELMAHNVHGIYAVAATAAMLGHSVEGVAGAATATREAVVGLVDRQAVAIAAIAFGGPADHQVRALLGIAFGISVLALGYVRDLARSLAAFRKLMGVR